MAAQEIAVTCKNCGNKTRCTVAEWSSGFSCAHCGISIQRPNPKNKKGGTDALATGKVQLNNLLRPTVSAVSLQPSDSPRPAAGESGSLKIIKQAVAAKPVEAVPVAEPAPAAPAAQAAPVETPPSTDSGAMDIGTTASVHRLKAENKSLRDQVKTLTIANAKADAELDVLRDQHAEITRKLNGLQNEVSTLKRARAKLQDQVRELSEESASADVKVREDLAEVRHARDEAESSLARLQIEHKIMKEKLDQFIKEKVGLGRQVEQLDEQRQNLVAEQQKLKAEAESNRADREALEKEKAELEKEQEKLQGEAVELAKKVIPQDKLDDFKKRFASEVAQNKITKMKLEQAGTELKRLHTELAKKDAMVKAIAVAKAKSDKQLESASSTSEEQEKAVLEVKILREKLDSLITELHNAEDTIKANDETIKKLSGGREGLDKELDAAKAELDKLKTDAEQKANERATAEAALKAEIETLKAQPAEPAEGGDSAAVNAAAATRITQLEFEITELNQQLADLEDVDSEELKGLKDENQELKAKVAGLEKAAADSSEGADADKMLELKKALAKSIAEGRIIREKMVAMLEDVKRSRAHIEALNQKNAELGEALKASTGNDVADATAIGELKATITRLEAEKEALNTKVNATLAADEKADEAEVNALKATIKDLEAKLDAKPADPADPSAPEGDSEELMRAKLEAQILREKVEQLVGELDEAHKAGDTPAAAPVDDTKLKEMEAANKVLSEKTAALQKELETLKAQPAAAAPAPAAPAPAGSPGEMAAELEKVKSELATARQMLEESDESAKSKKKGPGDKIKILELTEESKALTTEVEKLRKKVKQDRADAIKGMVVPGLSEDIDALARRNRELEHKLAALDQERHRLLAELEDWRDDGEKNDTPKTMELPVVKMSFPEAAQTIVRDVVGDAPVVYTLETQHKVDTGLWARKSTCYLAITPDDVVVVAAGKQDVLQKLPRTSAKESFWNPVTQQLVFSPGVPNAAVPGLTMTRDDADAAMAILHAGTVSVKAGASA